MDISARWWIRRFLHRQACNSSRQTFCRRTLFLSLLNSADITFSVDYFGPLSLTPRDNLYILIFTDRCSRRADMFAVTVR